MKSFLRIRLVQAGFSAIFACCTAATALGCGGSSPSANASPGPAVDAGPAEDASAPHGKTFTTAADAPKYAGQAFSEMSIYDLENKVYLDDVALVEALDDDKLVFFGEQHETAPVQELELWLLQRLTDRHDDVTLGMEHFQHDEQSVLDAYVLAGSISSAAFEDQSQPWNNYAKYWKPLVEHMKALGRPVVGLNVPDEALDIIYNAYPKKPLDVFNAWDGTFKYTKAIAPRPLTKWDATYENYFDGSFDYKTHGAQMGMTPADALLYFTDLAHIRDQTMAYFASQALAGGGRLLVVAGDWHVQTGLATPDRTIRYLGADAHYRLITTTPVAKFDETRTKTVSGRPLARFILVYQ